jgi:hypothetical protein
VTCSNLTVICIPHNFWYSTLSFCYSLYYLIGGKTLPFLTHPTCLETVRYFAVYDHNVLTFFIKVPCSLIVPIYTKVDKTDCSNYYWRISMLPTTYKIWSNILLSSLTPYTDEIIGDYWCGFWHNWSTTDQIFWSIRYWRKIGEQWENTAIIHRLQGCIWFS